jgi:hypothetical protein
MPLLINGLVWGLVAGLIVGFMIMGLARAGANN